MKRSAILVASLSLAVVGAMLVDSSPIAFAQPAAAIGQPLPDGNLPTGTVSVRIVAGSPSAPEVGVDVTLIVNGTPRQARTDAAGRATFGGLPPTAMVQAKALDADKKEISSQAFAIPGDTGVRLMLSTKPFQGAAGMPGPMAGGEAAGGGGMPPAREVSGQPRPDRSEPPGSYTVRLTYNDLQMGPDGPFDPNPPVGVPVYLVGYSADDSVKVFTVPTDKTGLAQFGGPSTSQTGALDQTGATSYFAMAALPRNGSVDRMVAVTVVLDGQSGARVVLSGEKRDSTAPPVDDYTKMATRDGLPTPAGKVRITLDGVGQDGMPVTLYDARTMGAISVANTMIGPPDPKLVRGGANFEPKADLPAGTLDVDVRGGMGNATDPLPDVEVRLITADEKPLGLAHSNDVVVGKSGADGKLRLTIAKVPDTGIKAVFVINGKEMVSAPMDISGAGGVLAVTAQWPTKGRAQATFENVKPGGVVFAQTSMSGQLFRSLPFQILAETGINMNIYVYPRTLFSFDTHSFVEDQLMAVQGTFEVTNYSWAPFRTSADGLLIKLPKGHKGAIIAPQDANEVSVAQHEGFRIMRPIPPGGRKFRAGYSMPIEHGQVNWSFDLPHGTWGSEMKIRQTPGMTVKLPNGVQGGTEMATTGEPWFIIRDITVDRGQSLTMTIAGFPVEKAWKVWAPRIVGVLVLLMIAVGIAFALGRGRAAPVADVEAKRAKLMDELVALEKAGITTSKERNRREQLVDELERMWGS